MTTSNPIVVVKVGGSLFDLPDVVPRLQHFLKNYSECRVLLITGGGTAANLVRTRDDYDEIGEVPSHWLAVRAMSFHSYVLESILGRSRVVANLSAAASAWQRGLIPILDPLEFLRLD